MLQIATPPATAFQQPGKKLHVSAYLLSAGVKRKRIKRLKAMGTTCDPYKPTLQACPDDSVVSWVALGLPQQQRLRLGLLRAGV